MEGGLEVVTAGFPPPPAGTDFSGLEAAQMITETGWNLEVKMPLSIFKMTATPGAAFGIEFNLNDDDDGGNRDGVLSWSGGAGVNNNTDQYGTAVLFDNASTTIAMTESEITIDGDADDDYMNSAWNMIGHAAGVLPLGNDLSGYWTGLYDAEFLYLLFDIIDDDLSVDTPDQLWNDDGLELFFDGNNSKSGNADGVDDVKIALTALPGETAPTIVTAGFPPNPAGTDYTGLEAAWVETDLGWRMELKVAFATLRISGLAGWTMGLEVSVQDDDFGGNRDHTVNWSAVVGRLNNNTGVYGNVTLEGDALFSTIIGATNVDGTDYDSSWFGMFSEDPAHGGWINHESLGWLYAGYAESGDTGFWMYSTTFNDWLYISEAYFEWVYFIAEGWGYLLVTDDGVLIYYYDSNSWVEIE
jgi:hypothetical protein